MSSLKSKFINSPPRGRLLWDYKEVYQLNPSVFLLFDQMYRHYTHHADSDAEARNYQVNLELKLTQLEKDIQCLHTENNQEALLEEVADIDLNSSLCEIAMKLQSRVKLEDIEKQKDIFLKQLRVKIDYLEYLQVAYTIKLNKLSEKEERNVSSSQENSNTLPPDFLHDVPNSNSSSIFKNSCDLESSESSSKNDIQTRSKTTKSFIAVSTKISKIEDKYTDLQNEIAVKTKELETLNNQINEKSHYLKELNLKIGENQHMNVPMPEQMNLSQASTYSIVSEDEYSEENNASSEFYQLPLTATQVKQKLKDLSLQANAFQSQANQDNHPKGMKYLEKDFIRFGRKTWNDKDVISFLRLYKKPYISSNAKTATLHPQVLLDVTHSILQVHFSLKDIETSIMNYHKDMTAEIDCLQKQKPKIKCMPLQQLHENFFKLISDKLEEISGICKFQEENLKSKQMENYEDLLKDFKIQLIEEFNTQVLDQIKMLSQNLPTDTNTRLSDNHKLIQNKSLEKKQLKKLIIIPNDLNQSSEIEKSLRDEIKKPEIRSSIRMIRKTTNKNIEIRTMDKDLEVVKKVLQTAESIQQYATLIEPSKKIMRILLLRIPIDITQEDLQNELNQNINLRDSDFEIVKSIQAKNKNFNNWQLNLNANIGRNLINRGRIKIFTDQIRIVHHLRVLRCTNCQAIDDHIARNCSYITLCANCAHEHHTSNCTESTIQCINCIRNESQETNHKASSMDCPHYQERKNRKLKNYYSGPLNQHEEEEYNFSETTPSRPRRTYNYEYPSLDPTYKNKDYIRTDRIIKNSSYKPGSSSRRRYNYSYGRRQSWEALPPIRR